MKPITYPTFIAIIPGRAESKGSKTAGRRKDGTTFLREDNPRVGKWMTQVKRAMREDKPKWPIDSAVAVRVIIFEARPKSQWQEDTGFLIPRAPQYPATTGGDIDKVGRAVLDSGNRLWWSDDKRVVDLHITRHYADSLTQERTMITCVPLQPWEEASELEYNRKALQARNQESGKASPKRRK